MNDTFKKNLMELSNPTRYPPSDSHNSEKNKDLVLQFRTEIITNGSVEVADEILSTDFTAHISGVPPEWQENREGIKLLAAAIKIAFPDVTFDYGLVFARGGKVVVQWTMTGTHRGGIFGILPTGNRVSVTGTDIYIVSPTGPGGKIIELWTSWDQWGMFEQLGVSSYTKS